MKIKSEKIMRNFETTLPSPRRLGRWLLIAAITATLPACNLFQRLSDVGAPPKLAAIENPVQKPDYKPVSLPMPRAEPANRHANSLWRPGARAFFEDQRASRVGDILTVLVEIEDEANVANTTNRSRDNSEGADLTNFFGLETKLDNIFPSAVDPTSLVDLGSNSNVTGKGSVDRKETISLQVAALITQVLPNGNLVISARQEVRVNFEVRELIVSGVVRPEDITGQNTIAHQQIAEARIAYGGRGQLTDVQQARYGQQLFDILMPF
jgi:flagellar L-ring protein precursor FlgH